LTGADLYDWIALRRVSDGGIARMGDRWFDSGLRVPGYVAGTLDRLCNHGLAVLAEPDMCGMERAAPTDDGTRFYQRLCRQRQAAQKLPPGKLCG